MKSTNFSNHMWIAGLLLVGVFFTVSFFSYDSNDLALYTSQPNFQITNWSGSVGAWLSGVCFFSLGVSAYLIPFLVLFWAIVHLLSPPKKPYRRLLSSVILFLSSSSLLSMTAAQNTNLRFQRGGILGLAFSDWLMKYFGRIGSCIIWSALLIFSLLLTTEFLIVPIFFSIAKVGGKLTVGLGKKVTGIGRVWPQLKSFFFKREEKERRFDTHAALRPPPKVKVEVSTVKRDIPRIRVEPQKPKPKTEQPVLVEANAKPKPSPVVKKGGYQFPSLELLNSPPPIAERKIEDNLRTNSEILESTLRDFGIEVKVIEAERGPTITTYELEPAPGVKIHKITELADDIALAMKASAVRIVAPIPGKGRIGVEVPNTVTTLLYIKEILESSEFQRSSSKLPLTLGKDISGGPVIADLTEMPHLLIAGTTGSGKTVCVNSIITSLIFAHTPDEVKFIMVDPKMVELAIFNGLPHLLCPVVTEAKKVSGALKWVVNEMESRYKLFAKAGARNIGAFNEKASNKNQKAVTSDQESESYLPYIVVIIDELADLMVVASVEIESTITRLAQLSRAVGIHMILATQRPSVDVITGVIKANFPARVSFKVASKVDSRTVLDMNGADKLLGKGDMLFLKPGTSKPIRAQGSLIQDSEIERVVEFIKSQQQAQYDEEIIKFQEKPPSSFRDTEKDELFDEAVKLVLETQQASVSILQRRLRLGYTRAARLIDMMEAEGIVGPFKGSRPRAILIEKEESTQ